MSTDPPGGPALLGDLLPAQVLEAVAELDPFDPAWALAGRTTHGDGASDDPHLVDQLRRLLASATAENTRRAHAADWRRFSAWCRTRGHPTLPAAPLTLALYLADAARTLHADTGRPAYAAATLTRWVSSIGRAHAATGHPSPTVDPLVRATLSGIRRAHGVAPARKRALLLTDLKALLGHLPDYGWPAGITRRRDYLLLLLGWAGAFRRSELVGLDVGDLTAHLEDGLHIQLRRSKTDQAGTGQLKAIPYGSTPATCAPCALRAWREILDAADRAGTTAVRQLLEHEMPRRAHICRGPAGPDPLPPDRPLLRPITRHGAIAADRLAPAAVAGILKRYAARAGLNPNLIAGHSLRAGFATQAGRAGASVSAIMAQTGHRSPAMVYVYLRRAAPLDDNAVTDIGL